MAFVHIHTFMWFLVGLLVMASQGTDTDIYCLKSIKNSLEDPLNSLSSWDFKNISEVDICGVTGVTCWTDGQDSVLNLKLSNMRLKGQFPRGIQNCTSLTRLDLSNNDLLGQIPSDIPRLIPFATTIDLSNNRFTGEIPKGLFNCSYLNLLKLDNNQLSGQIPEELALMPRLTLFSVANNNLSGPLPVFHSMFDFPVESYANNSGLCGDPLPPCTQIRNSTSFHQAFKQGLIVGYAFSVTSVFVCYTFYCVCEPRKQVKLHRRSKDKYGGEYCFPSISGKKKKLTRQMIQLKPPKLFMKEGNKEQIFTLLERVTSRIRFAELYNATECFSVDNIIGFGKMGIMYEARLENGCFLAIKRLLSDSEEFLTEFVSEITILSKYKHQNIVPLIGFCTERKQRLLVYQYMSNGRLSKWLNPLEDEALGLEWLVRVKIALGIARGLSWLHHRLHIIHMGLSSECILLDQNFEPKISNFGEAIFMSPNPNDELSKNFCLNINDSSELRFLKKDVYDFGSVLFELITGKKFHEMTDSSDNTELSANPLDFYDEIDQSLVGKGFEDEIFVLLKVACHCVQPVPDQRPTMLQLYNNMSTMWERHKLTNDSDMLRQSETGSAATCSSGDEIVEL